MEARRDAPSSREYHSYKRLLDAMELMKGGVSDSEVATIFDVSSKTVKLWKLRYKEMEMNHDAQEDSSMSLDGEVFKWYLDLTKEGQYVTREMIVSKVKEINFKIYGVCNFSPSLSWASKWKKRYGLFRRSLKKSSQMIPTGPFPEENNNVNKNEHQPLYTFISNIVQEGQHQSDKDDLEGEDEILKELDRLLSSFQRKIIDRDYESDEECPNRDRSSHDTLPSKAKMVAKKGQVGNHQCRSSAILEDVSPKKNWHSGVQTILKQVNQQIGVMFEVQEEPETYEALQEDVELHSGGNISDKEEQTCNSAASDTCSAMSVESYDTKDEEELEYVRKEVDITANKTETQMENWIIQTSHLISDSDEEKEIPSNKYIHKKKKACPKEIEFDEGTTLNIDKFGDNKHNEDSLNANEFKTEVPNSGPSESGVILLSSGEDSDEDDIIFVENKCETIVIDASDGEEGEKSEQEEHHQHSQFKIILLKTKDGDGDFSMVDSGSLESEPKVIVFDK